MLASASIFRTRRQRDYWGVGVDSVQQSACDGKGTFGPLRNDWPNVHPIPPNPDKRHLDASSVEMEVIRRKILLYGNDYIWCYEKHGQYNSSRECQAFGRARAFNTRNDVITGIFVIYWTGIDVFFLTTWYSKPCFAPSKTSFYIQVIFKCFYVVLSIVETQVKLLSNRAIDSSTGRVSRSFLSIWPFYERPLAETSTRADVLESLSSTAFAIIWRCTLPVAVLGILPKKCICRFKHQ